VGKERDGGVNGGGRTQWRKEEKAGQRREVGKEREREGQGRREGGWEEGGRMRAEGGGSPILLPSCSCVAAAVLFGAVELRQRRCSLLWDRAL